TDHCPSAEVHLSDPVAPLFGGFYTLLSFPDLSFAARNASYDILGRPAQLTVSDVRSAPGGTVTLLTYTLAERDQLRTVLASGRTLIFRMPPEFGDPLLYIVVGDAVEARALPDVRRPERQWTLPFNVADRPGGLVDTGVSNWQNV